MDWLIYSLPWWVQAMIGAALAAPFLFLVARGLGLSRALKATLVTGGLLVAFALERRARQAGWTARMKREARDGDALVEKAGRARAASAASAADDPQRLRDDDGFRRP